VPESDANAGPEHAPLPPSHTEPTLPEPLPEAILAQARAEVAQEARAIAELCLLAGCPERTTTYLAAGLSEAEVRRTLLESRAQQPEIRSTITTEASTASREAQHPEKSPVVAAVRKLHSTHPTAEA
jgi:capsid assembly protease